MRNFEEILAKNKGIVKTLDLTVCRLIGKGGDGSVYQLTPERCVKIFVNEETQKRELKH
jgi:putative serine/threonine protein kinase